MRKQLVRVIHNEDTFHVQLHAMYVFSVPKVKRSGRRNIQKLDVFVLAFNLVVRPAKRIGRVVRNVVIELFVLVFSNFILRTCPKSCTGVDGFPFSGVNNFIVLVFILAH